MLIQITNMCHEGCRHCLQASTPNGEHMTFDTFKNAVKFGLFLKIQTFVISGGEPTEHPQLLEFCQWLDKYLGKTKTAFTITSNGTWYPEKKDQIAKLASLRHYVGMQVYTNKQWYKDYDFIMSHRLDFEQMGKMVFDSEPIFMQDLGRARGDEEAQKCVSENPYHILLQDKTRSPKISGNSHSPVCAPANHVLTIRVMFIFPKADYAPLSGM